MSSHHIVREKQEPALYIHHLGAFSEEYLGQLLEWSPTLIVNALEYEKVLSLGLKVDIVVNPPDTLILQENTRKIHGVSDDLKAVLEYLVAERYPAVNIIDKKNNLLELSAYIPQIDMVVFTETEKAYAIKPGFSVWKTAGSIFRIQVLSYFETSNLRANENEDFVVINDGFVQFNFSTPHLIISEEL